MLRAASSDASASRIGSTPAGSSAGVRILYMSVCARARPSSRAEGGGGRPHAAGSIGGGGIRRCSPVGGAAAAGSATVVGSGVLTWREGRP
eukprot:5325729-Prymnesium_polylepis.1